MTLTELSYYGRKMMPFFVILCLLIFIIFYLFRLLFLLIQVQRPINQIRINPVFGKIKGPTLEKSTANIGFNYVLDNIEGQPITATAAAQVYFLPPTYSRFKYLQQIYLMAKTAGIDADNIKYKLTGTEAYFDDGRQQMTIDITNFNFTYEYNLKTLNQENFFVDSKVIDEKEIEEKATNFLSALGRYPDELLKGKKNIIYLKYNSALNEIKIDSRSETANMAEVDFYRQDIGDMMIVSPSYFNSQNYVMIGFGKDGFRIIKAQVKFFEKSEEQVGIYPLKSGTVAWEDLKAGKNIIVSSSQEKKDITIKKMTLGYFDPDVYQEYLQPVYVFLGEDNFVAYVSAVEEQYLSE